MSDGAIRLKTVAAGDLPTPPSGRVWLFFDSDNNEHLSTKLDDGSVVDLQNALNYTDEKAQDAVGSILTDTSDISFNYDDVGNEITAVLVSTSVIPGSYGSASQSAIFTVDAKGRLTAASSAPISILSTQVSDFTEAVQDAALPAFQDTASIDFTYDDPSNSISAVVLPAGVNHDLLQNFVANKHIDHSLVEVQTPSLSGLSGGGNLTATRTLSLNINNLQAQTANSIVPMTSEIAYYDPSISAHRKALKTQMLARNPDLFHNEFSDFIVTTLGGLTTLASGTGASAQAGTFGQDNAENCKGVVQYDTGTTATGRAGLGSSTNNPMFLQASDFYRLQFRAAIEALSTTGVEAFSWYPCAFTNAINATGFGLNYAGFFYREDENGGRYQFVVYSNGVLQAALDTGFLADIDYQIFEVTLDGATGTARGYINNNLVATVSSGLFSGPTDTFGFVSKIEKRVGTAQRNADLDWYNFEYYRVGGR
jgi:hypothetical protein